MSESVVVYFYSDPNYHGDLTPTMSSLKARGFRVVRGDNADELLFLLQVGRPVAVIYTLSSREARSSSSYQMVSRRALDLLVPIFLVGPEDPRDGVVLVLPEGGRPVESHIPFHALGDLIAKFDKEPPSTASRPPAAIHQETIGKGKTILNWQGGGPLPSRAPEWKKAQETLHGHIGQPPSTPPPVGSIPPVNPRLLEKGDTIMGHGQASPATRETFSAKKKPAADRGGDLGAESVERDAKAAGEPLVVDIDRLRSRPEPRPEQTRPAPRKRSIAPRIALVSVGAVLALAAIALVAYLALRPSVPAPTPLPRTPARVAGPSDLGTADTAASSATGVGIARSEPPTSDEHRFDAGLAPQTVGSLEYLPDGAARFPGHFREGTATFWFAAAWEENDFLSLVERSAPGSAIVITGHPTVRETQDGQVALGTSRAWAVEKYLIRNGVDPGRIRTERGPAVEARSDIDERGWARNRWVDVRFQ